MLRRLVRIVTLASAILATGVAANVAAQPAAIVWRLDNLRQIGGHPVTVVGQPRSVDTAIGRAIAFDGRGDGLVLDVNPLAGLARFTVEIVFQPAPDGPEEQRFLHFEEAATGNRALIELRQRPDTRWALDTYLRSGEAGLTLLDRELAHPAGRWHVAALTFDGRTMTHFVNGRQTYTDFAASLPGVILANPDMLFIVKPHPLSLNFELPPTENLIIARREDNIHVLLDAATAVIVYNSGVGLLALLHGKPVISIGNAFYNYPGAGHRASSLAEAVVRAREMPAAPTAEMVARLAAWFLLRKYSTFIAADAIRDHGHRKSHGYRDVQVTHFRWEVHDIALGRQRDVFPLSNRSYIWARIGMEPPRAQSAATPRWGAGKRVLHLASRIAIAPFQSQRDKERLRTDPVDFFGKAKHPLNQFFGRLLLEKSQRTY